MNDELRVENDALSQQKRSLFSQLDDIKKTLKDNKI